MHADEPYGTLYLLPVWLGDAGGLRDMPEANAGIAVQVDLIFCENERSARRMLRRYHRTLDLNAKELHVLDKDSTPADAQRMIALLRHGRDAAIMSEAGMPGIADPGALLVQAAHKAGITVVPLIGPSSLLLALAASGLNGQRFSFHGYLPREGERRKQELRRLEQEAQRGGAQLFIETPYRNEALLADLLTTCTGSSLLCLAVDLGQPGGSVHTRSVQAWRERPPALGKRPCVFILGVR
jgi:16S rRNA (cytidine1402-2'-O)-methyltransferase